MAGTKAPSAACQEWQAIKYDEVDVSILTKGELLPPRTYMQVRNMFIVLQDFIKRGEKVFALNVTGCADQRVNVTA